MWFILNYGKDYKKLAIKKRYTKIKLVDFFNKFYFLIFFMNIYKKTLSWFLLSSLFIWNISFSFASIEHLTTPTQEEKLEVETEILKLQSNIFSNSKMYFEKLISDFEKLTNYEESWSSKIDFLLDEPAMFWKADLSFDFKDYIVKNSNLDSDIFWNVSLKANYLPVYGTGFELNLTTFASLISKDSEMYALLKDFDFKVTDENISKILEVLQKEFKDNKYIKLPTDENSQIALEMLKKIQSNSIINETETILSKPLFQTYKKNWDKFLLVPTKYACEIYFELEQKFNFLNRWYTPKTCTNSVYKSFVKKFIKAWELYLTIGDTKNIFGFFVKNDDNTIVDFLLNYDKNSISRIDFIITPDKNKFKEEWFNFYFKSWEYLKLFFSFDNKKTFVNFDSELDKNNNFIEINSNIKSTEITWSFALKDKKITWFYILKQKWYDYSSQNFDYKLENVYGIKITWNFNSDNTLEKLNTKITWIDLKNKKAFLIWKIFFNSWDFTVNFSIKDDYWNFDFHWKWFIDSKYIQLNSNFNSMWIYTWKLNILMDQKNDKNNANIDFNIKNWTKDIIKFNMINDAKRVHKDNIKIVVPSDFKDFDMSWFESINY